jgi:hypothetical protein
MQPQVLQLDVQGTPQAWITPQSAALHYATDAVAWEGGHSPLAVFRGGWNSISGRQSEIVIQPIVALRGASRVNLFDNEPAITRAKIFKRDRYTCAYCALTFPEKSLQVEHIYPQSRGGASSWSNLVSSCAACNTAKAARSPEEARMPLVYLPYRPSRWEDFLLAGRNVRADVHDFLVARLPRTSRLC